MHAAVKIGDTMVMASDGRCKGKPKFNGFALTITAKNDAEAEKTVRRAVRRRPGADAADQDLLLAEVRHARRQVRRRLDGHRRAVIRHERNVKSGGRHDVDPNRQQSSDFVISRVFDAPRDLVWKCFTDPEHMKQWWGPKGFTVVASKMDLRSAAPITTA